MREFALTTPTILLVGNKGNELNLLPGGGHHRLS